MALRCIAVAALLVLTPHAASTAPICAAQEAGTLFHCKIKGSSREVTVCDLAGDRFLYSYGKPGSPPEIELFRQKSEVFYTPWNGISRSIWAKLGFENKGYRYEVIWSVLKGGSEPAEGYLDIFEPGNDNPVATKECAAGTVDSRLDGLWERFE